jgi:hypothetical protein
MNPIDHIEYPKKERHILNEFVVGSVEEILKFFSFVDKNRFDSHGKENQYYEMHNDNILSIENSINFAAIKKYRPYPDTVHFWERNDENPNNPKQCVKYIKVIP